VSAGGDGSAVLFDMKSGQIVNKFMPGEDNEATALAVSQSGAVVFVGYASGDIMGFSALTGEHVIKPLSKHKGNIASMGSLRCYFLN
jgi:WD40 repeat protein